jgi:tRNA threonylcarbamoyladenosine biosynthesis protein TsaE
VTRELVLSSRRDTVRLGRRLAATLRPGDLVLLRGPLGAGKTFLARAVVRSLGVREGVTITSPTFSLVHEYATQRGELLHADFFRLLDDKTPLTDAIGRLGLRERRAEGAIVIAEWAEAGLGALGGTPELTVTLSSLGPNARTARIEGTRASELA